MEKYFWGEVVPPLADFLLTQSLELKEGDRKFKVYWSLFRDDSSLMEGRIAECWDSDYVDGRNYSHTIYSSDFVGLPDGTWKLEGGLVVKKQEDIKIYEKILPSDTHTNFKSLGIYTDFSRLNTGRILPPGICTSHQMMTAIQKYMSKLSDHFSK